MKALLPQKLKALAANLNAPLYVVGGFCRDFLSGLTCDKFDFDVCAPCSAEELIAAAKLTGVEVCATYKNTGTVKLRAEGNDIEFTSFRSDEYVRGEHNPARVYFTKDIVKDALRRDFKCNAVYYDIKAGEFADPLGGIADIKARVINTVTDPAKVFGEDGLRLMRLARQAAQTGFTPTSDCIEGAIKNAALIKDITAERVRTELDYILTADKKYGVADGHYKGLEILKETNVLSYILPELTLGDKMPQREDFHNYDVLEHSLRCVLYAPENIRLAALLHDIGKPYCRITTGKFACHDVEGERIAAEVCARLRVPKKLAERVCRLIRWHMYDLSGAASENKIKKFYVANADIWEDLLALKQADYSACKDDLSPAPCVVKWRRIYLCMAAEGVPLNLKQLSVKGDELIAAGVPKEKCARVLNFLLGECAIGNVANQKEKLVKFALSSLKNL